MWFGCKTCVCSCLFGVWHSLFEPLELQYVRPTLTVRLAVRCAFRIWNYPPRNLRLNVWTQIFSVASFCILGSFLITSPLWGFLFFHVALISLVLAMLSVQWIYLLSNHHVNLVWKKCPGVRSLSHNIYLRILNICTSWCQFMAQSQSHELVNEQLLWFIAYKAVSVVN